MRVICKPDVKQQLDALIEKALRGGKEIDYIELTREEFSKFSKLKSEDGRYYFEMRVNTRKGSCFEYAYNGYEIKVIANG